MAEKQAKTENALVSWENAEFGTVRSMAINDEPWFVGKDVAVALGYNKPSNALAAHVDSEDKTTAPIQGSGPKKYKTRATFINESGLYALIFGSQLDSAKKFKRWVTGEVLPSIRKRGTYGVAPVVSVRELTGAIDKLTERVSALEQASVRNALPDMTDLRESLVAFVKKAAKEHRQTEREAWFYLYSGYAKLSGIPLFKCAKAMDMSVISFVDIIGRMDSLRRFAEQLFWDVAF